MRCSGPVFVSGGEEGEGEREEGRGRSRPPPRRCGLGLPSLQRKGILVPKGAERLALPRVGEMEGVTSPRLSSLPPTQKRWEGLDSASVASSIPRLDCP